MFDHCGDAQTVVAFVFGVFTLRKTDKSTQIFIQTYCLE